MERLEMRISIKDGTSKEQIVKAISRFENAHKSNVISFFAASNHRFVLIDYDGISVSKWYGNIDEFIVEDTDYQKMELAMCL